MTGSKLPAKQIFDYDPIGLNVRRPARTITSRPPSLLPSKNPIHDPASGEMCWSGYCNKGCGRALVSAVTRRDASPGLFACGLCG